VTGEAESAAALALSLSLRVNPARNCHPEIAALIRHDRLGSFVATLRYEREARERGRSPFACEMDEMLGSFLRSLEMGLSQIAGIPVPASAPTIAAAYERPRLGMQFRK
jgi:hypothetical protein